MFLKMKRSFYTEKGIKQIFDDTVLLSPFSMSGKTYRKISDGKCYFVVPKNL